MGLLPIGKFCGVKIKKACRLSGLPIPHAKLQREDGFSVIAVIALRPFFSDRVFRGSTENDIKFTLNLFSVSAMNY